MRYDRAKPGLLCDVEFSDPPTVAQVIQYIDYLTRCGTGHLPPEVAATFNQRDQAIRQKLMCLMETAAAPGRTVLEIIAHLGPDEVYVHAKKDELLRQLEKAAAGRPGLGGSQASNAG